MKKFYNKALFYRAFISCRGLLFLCIPAWTFAVYFILQDGLNTYKLGLGSLTIYKGDVTNSFLLTFAFLIFISAIYIGAYVVNKREYYNYIYSGPYSREEIKNSEIGFMIFSIFIGIICFIYAAICICVKNRLIISYFKNYYITLACLAMLIAIIAFIYIFYLISVDMVFSNPVYSLFTIVILPISVVITLAYFLQNIIDLFRFQFIYDLVDIIINSIGSLLFINPFYLRTWFFKDFIPMFIIIVLCIILLYIVIINIVKSIKINGMNKLFTVEKWGKLIRIIYSTGIASILALMINEVFWLVGNNILFNNIPLINLFIWIVLFIIVDLISKKIIYRYNNK